MEHKGYSMYNSGDIRSMKNEFKAMVEDKFNKRMNCRYVTLMHNMYTIKLCKSVLFLFLIAVMMYLHFAVILQSKEILEGSCILGGMLKLLSRRQLVRD